MKSRLHRRTATIQPTATVTRASRSLVLGVLLLLTWWRLDGLSSMENAQHAAVHALAAPSLPPITQTQTRMEPYLPLARQAMAYFDASTDPFHAVQASIDLLQKAGFQALNEATPYSAVSGVGVILPGGKYYYTRNKSTLVAFCVGPQWKNELQSQQQSPWGFKIIGGHTDSPNLRVKPRSRRRAADCIQIGVECYGGGLWHTWFDRDLGLSGRVLVRNNHTQRIEQRLVQIDRALLRISNLAIHLRTAKEREAFEVNKEDHLSPILALEAKTALSVTSTTDSTTSEEESKKENNNDNNNKNGWTEHQEPALLQILAAELNCTVQDIVDFELCLFDVQKAALGGAYSEFVHSARLDNLASCFMAVQALQHHANSSDWLETDRDVSMIVLYDHEEVGSTSAVGAASPILREAVERITAALFHGSGGENSNTMNNSVSDMNDRHEACLRNSFVLSSDQAHAVHPNYASKHEKYHQPKMNQGMVIKRNTNQRYATTPLTGVLMREVARRASLPPLQEFIVRQDCGCGSTIGPAISAATGIRTIDMGCPQLSMHSIRETMGVCDLTNGLNLFKAFFAHFREVDSSVEQ